MILSAISPYFKTMFTGSLRESEEKEVEIDDVDGVSLGELIRFCYSGQVNLSEDKAESLLKCASFFQIIPVVNACGNFMVQRLELSNCIGFLRFAETYNCENLLHASISFCEENFLNLHDNEEFQILDESTLSLLLKSSKIVVDSEEDAFNMMLRWIRCDFENRKQLMHKLLSLIRLQALSAEVKLFFLDFHSKFVKKSF